MVRSIKCKLNNPYGPNCQSAETLLCVMCSYHFRSGGSQRRHQCRCGYSTRCIRQLVDQIITMQIPGIEAEEVDFADVDLVEGETHRVSCTCVVSRLINELKWLNTASEISLIVMYTWINQNEFAEVMAYDFYSISVGSSQKIESNRLFGISLPLSMKALGWLRGHSLL